MGKAAPVRHSGSIDVFLEILQVCQPGDVLVIDNRGHLDEACIGDLVALDAEAAGVVGMVLWGVHRDTVELQEIGLPIFSYGRFASGPTKIRPREPDALIAANFGSVVVTSDDIVFGDDDGVLFVSSAVANEVLATAHAIWVSEREQARRIRSGTTLREQTEFTQFIERRAREPLYTFRQHLRNIDRAIEE